MAQYLRPETPLKLVAFAAFLLIALCGLSIRAQAQWNLEAMLEAKTDWFAHQCYIADTPELKIVTFMAVGDYKLFRFIMQDNEMMTSSYDFDHKEGTWKVAGEQAFGRGEEIKKAIYRVNFKIVTSKQFNTMIKSQPKEACKD